MTLLIRERLVNDLCVHAELLPGCRAGEEGEHEGKIIEIPDEALHADERDVNRGNGCNHPSIAFVGDKANCTSFSNRKIRSADSYISGEEDFAQNFARSVGEGWNIFGVWNVEFFMKELTHILTPQM